VTQKTTWELLPPSVHLTQPCNRDVRKCVASHPGWSSSRVAATPEKKRAHKETRQTTCYFTKVTFDPKKAPKQAAPAATKAPLAAVHPNVEPAAKKAKTAKTAKA
jgi:hypothetical protein